LESPYHGVRLTGQSAVVNGVARVDLPDYIGGLCRQDGAQVQITNIQHGKVLWVEELNVEAGYFVVKTTRSQVKRSYEFYWSFTAIRQDIDDMPVEINTRGD
jgi:hypothetical protein